MIRTSDLGSNAADPEVGRSAQIRVGRTQAEGHRDSGFVEVYPEDSKELTAQKTHQNKVAAYNATNQQIDVYEARDMEVHQHLRDQLIHQYNDDALTWAALGGDVSGLLAEY